MKLQIKNIFWVRQLVRKLGFEVPIDFSIEDVVVTEWYHNTTTNKDCVDSTRFSNEEEYNAVLILPTLNRVYTSYAYKIVKKDFSILMTEEEFEQRMLSSQKRICKSNATYKMGACNGK